MSIDWSTFVLEIINFLVLVWILQRFLYRPVLAVIARRRADIERTLEEARSRDAAAKALEATYQGRLEAWEKERAASRAALAQEMDAERARRLAELDGALAAEREKARAAAAAREADVRRTLERRAVANATRFAARLLRAAAGPDIETRLVDEAITALVGLGGEQVAALRRGWGVERAAIRVVSAYPLDADRRRRLAAALGGIAGTGAAIEFSEDPQVVAGVRILLGAWTLGVNIADELYGFAELADVA